MSKTPKFSTNKITNLLIGEWSDYFYDLHNQLLLPEQIEIALKNYWLEIVEKLEKDLHILIMFKIQNENGDIRSISYLEVVNVNDLNKLIIVFKEFWNLKDEEYHQYIVNKIILLIKFNLQKELKVKLKSLDIKKS